MNQFRSRAKLLTKDEARRIAANIAKLPGVICSQPPRSANFTDRPRLICGPNATATTGIIDVGVTEKRSGLLFLIGRHRGTA